MAQTWRSVCCTNNASLWYLGLDPQNEAKLAYKDYQSHCSVSGTVRKQRDNDIQGIQ